MLYLAYLKRFVAEKRLHKPLSAALLSFKIWTVKTILTYMFPLILFLQCLNYIPFHPLLLEIAAKSSTIICWVNFPPILIFRQLEFLKLRQYGDFQFPFATFNIYDTFSLPSSPALAKILLFCCLYEVDNFTSCLLLHAPIVNLWLFH